MNRPLPGFGVNVTLHDMDEGNLDLLIERIKDLRFEWVRYEFDFRGEVDSKLERKWIEKCRKAGIKVLGLLNYSMPGTILNTLWPERKHSPIFKQQKEFNRFVQNTVKQYSKMINRWEIWNEPNTKRFWVGKPNPEEYVGVLKKSAALIKKIQPKAQIVFGGVMGGDTKKMVPFQMLKFFQKSVVKGAGKHFDISNFHPYSFDNYVSLKSLPQQIESSLNRMKEAYAYAVSVTKKPVWFSEFGVANKWTRLTGAEIARLYWECYLWCRKKRVPLFLWNLYDLRNSQIEFFSPENSFGLLDKNLKPKKTFTALKELVEEYGGCDMVDI